MDVVQNYSESRITKAAAFTSILAAFSESELYQGASQDQIEAAIGTYINILDRHNDTCKQAATRGRRPKSVVEWEDSEDGDQVHSVGSKRLCSDSLDARTLSKKKAPDETLFAWLATDSVDSKLLTPSQELAHELVQNHMLDIKTTRCKVLSAKQVSEFPNSEWTNVLSGKAINLDAVFSGMYFTDTDNRAVENISDLKLHFSTSKPAKSVETHGDWIIAW
jgi:hypothetical protein